MKQKRRGPNKPPQATSKWRRLAHRPWCYGSLFMLAAVIVVQHLVAHAGFRPLPLSMGWQDIVVGYPTAVVMGVVALVLWGSDPIPR